MQSQLKRAIDLIKKTGDKLLIADTDEKVYAVMNLDEYEELLLKKSEVHGLTEDGLIDKINRDVAIWKSERGEAVNDRDWLSVGNSFFGQDKSVMPNESLGLPDWQDRQEDGSFSGLDEVIARKQDEFKGPKNKWSIPENRKKMAEEIVESEEEAEDEDRQYLEELTF